MAQLTRSDTRYVDADVSTPNLTIGVALFFAFNVGIAFLMQASLLISTLHAFVTIAAGVYFLIVDDEPHRMLYVAGYIVGVELLWRGTGASVFWETGKYAVTLLLILSLIKHKFDNKANIAIIFYFLLLVPSVVQARIPNIELIDPGRLTTIDMPFYWLGLDRRQIAFNLSGPFLLAVATLYFSRVTFTRRQLTHLFTAIIGGAIGLVAISIAATLTLDPQQLAQLNEGTEVTSANIGANQVSSILGLGGYLAAVVVLDRHIKGSGLKLLFMAASIVLLGQALLTFSRGGFWGAIIAIVVFIAFLLPKAKQLNWPALISIALGAVLLFGFLNVLTTGNVTERFTDTDPTGRDEVIREEIGVFLDNPVFGVGPGQRSGSGELLNAAHTEYTRVLAEHGLLGAFSWVFLFGVGASNYFNKKLPMNRALSASTVAWTLFYFVHAATRLSASGFVFALSSIQIREE
jgi:hypothetical protein